MTGEEADGEDKGLGRGLLSFGVLSSCFTASAGAMTFSEAMSPIGVSATSSSSSCSTRFEDSDGADMVVREVGGSLVLIRKTIR